MKDYSIPMALVDYIPVVLFLISSVLLQRGLYNKLSKGLFALFACGTIDIFIAGALKATYKLLYALNICDFPALSDLFMPLQSIGFLLAGLSVLICVFKKNKGTAVLAVAPPMFKGTFLFIGIMILGMGALLGGLSVFGIRAKKRYTVIIFICSFAAFLCMGFLSTRDFDLAIFNWLAEAVNIIGQLLLLLGVIALRKAKAFEN